MSWMADIDSYCERVAPGFGGEPFNSLTGLAFLVVGGWVAARATSGDVRNAGRALALVGCASALSHAFALRLTSWADMLANLGYLVLLGVVFLRGLAGAGRSAALAAAAVTVALAHGFVTSPGAQAILGPLADIFVLQLVLMLCLALLFRARHPGSARGLAAASAVLAAGLPLRLADAALCPVWPLGTHGFWHLCNAAATAVLLATLARHGATDRPWLAQRNAGR